MKILFIHQNFPGQYKHLAPALAAQGHEVRALGMRASVSLPGVAYTRYGTQRGSCRGQRLAHVARHRQRGGSCGP